MANAKEVIIILAAGLFGLWLLIAVINGIGSGTERLFTWLKLPKPGAGDASFFALAFFCLSIFNADELLLGMAVGALGHAILSPRGQSVAQYLRQWAVLVAALAPGVIVLYLKGRWPVQA
jgi:hypothetical protein